MVAIEKSCKNCGKKFQAKTTRALYCSDKCRAAYNMREKRKREKKILPIIKRQLKSKFLIIAVLAFIAVTVIFYYIPGIIQESQNKQLQEISKQYKAEKKINNRFLNFLQKLEKEKDINVNIEELKKHLNAEREKEFKKIDTVIFRMGKKDK